MRYEFAKPHQDLKAAMIYVTHDQVEAARRWRTASSCCPPDALSRWACRRSYEHASQSLW